MEGKRQKKSLSSEGITDADKILWIEVLRIAACFAVVVFHVGSMQFSSIQAGTQKWQALNFWRSLASFAVPVFFMISGLLYLDPLKKISVSQLYKRNIGKLFITYWFWILFYGVWNVTVYLGIRTNADELIKEIVKTAFLSPPAHMWYLPALIGILMISPILRLITEKEDSDLLKYTIVLCFGFGIIRKTLLLFEIPHKELVSSVINSIIPELTSGWIGCFLAGFYINRRGLSRKEEYGLYFMGMLSIFAGILLNLRSSLQTGTAVDSFCSNLTLFPTMYALAVFVFFMKHKWNAEKIQKTVLKVSRCTLGIYILHPCWIDVFEKMDITAVSYSPWIMVPVLGLVVFAASWICTFILKQIPVLGKWLC